MHMLRWQREGCPAIAAGGQAIAKRPWHSVFQHELASPRLSRGHTALTSQQFHKSRDARSPRWRLDTMKVPAVRGPRSQRRASREVNQEVAS